ncbi:MAG TPA: FKBP-type peptidyl-prolyl cis-trans isomerase [Thermodesulfovibrionales bacterium]|nr:FKBP-type peptidyl-prolyl cis-trans isomerase [Thermodesulfovibrionales bacterium]
MKLRWLVVISIVLFASYVYAGEDLVLKDQKDKLSYSIGMNIGNNFKKQSIDVNPDVLIQGIKDALSGGKTLMTEQEVNETLMNFQKEMMAKQMARQKELGEKNKKEGEAFLAENMKKEDVKTLPSGLQYKVIKEGDGKTPKITDTVTVHYRGTLIDGTEFDSSYTRGQPATFPVKGVIAGLTEALQLMKVGSKWQLFIPSNLAYGERGAGDDIGPNATLIFEVELVSIKEQASKEEKKEEKKP